MRKLLLLIFIELVLNNFVYSLVIDTTTAKTVAYNFYLSRAALSTQKRVRNIASKHIELELAHQEYDDEIIQKNVDPYYYVFRIKGNNGFVIVSADDFIAPILAYSFDGKYNTDLPLPPAYIDWMDKYKKFIKYIRENKLIQTNYSKSLWEKSMLKDFSGDNVANVVEPLLDKDSIKWGQGCNYNLFCPESESSIKTCMRAPVGCVAVALGQIMRYWKYPKKSNSITGYLNIALNSGTLSGWINGIDETTYNWDNIKNTLIDSTSEVEKRSVSELLYNCGVSVKMGYGPKESGAKNEDALISFREYFDYSNDLQLIKKINYNGEEWLDKIKFELKNSRPVYYSGNGESDDGSIVGHAFVCDGYNSNNEFHFNWGWNGSCNGYFYHLSSLVPQKYGKVNETYDFTDNQIAIIGIIPNKPDLLPINPAVNKLTIQAGSIITASCAEYNRSPTDAGAHVISVYLSIDSLLSDNKIEDLYLGVIPVSEALSGTLLRPSSKSFRIPSNVVTGNYYVIFNSDGGQAIDECFEDNNSAFVKLIVTSSGIDSSSIKKISKLEYFIDSDPGFGNGIKLNETIQNDIDRTYNIQLNNILEGFHMLYIRAKDIDNKWSITQNMPFYKLQVNSSSIIDLEYFIDTDPGCENGSRVSLSSKNNIYNSVNISLSDISNGFHVLYVRVKDVNGNWSITNNSAFYKTDVCDDIVKIEYYIDQDPGFGKAKPVTITKGADVSKFLKIDLSNTTKGFHNLFIRSKNASGEWSLNTTCPFYCIQSKIANLTELEYFFDKDPGFGYGNSIPVGSASSNFTKLFNVDLACLTAGNHIFYVRVKDDLRNWSLINSKDIYVNSIAPVITQNENILISNVITGNQWYNQDGLITGATNQKYVVTADGYYYVIVTHSNCSSEKSNMIKMIVSGLEKINNSIKIFPNPVAASFRVSGLNYLATLKLFDISGKEMLATQVSNNEDVQISFLPKGLYIVKLITMNGIVECKIIKK